MRIGVCASVATMASAVNTGLDYLEENVQALLVPQQDDAAFAAKLAAAGGVAVPIKAANCFLPGALKCVGPAVDMPKLVAYAQTAFARAAQVGIEVIVFGSGGARQVPPGFDVAAASQQFVAFLRELGPLAEAQGVFIAVEPLNRAECNFINSLEEGAALVTAANHPHIRLLADLYHMAREQEEPDELEIYGELIRHVHIAEVAERTCPGIRGDDFRPYLQALKYLNYYGGISIECRWQDFATELPVGTRYLRRQLQEVGY